MYRSLIGCLALSVWFMAGCGPTVSEARTSSYPPREKNCALEFVKIDNETMSGQGPWEVIGQVAIGDTGTQDPYDEKLKAIVRPRACGMGGEAVAIWMNAATQTTLSSGSAVTYAVLRKRSTQPEAPKQF
jgi:hypothetical protein